MQPLWQKPEDEGLFWCHAEEASRATDAVLGLPVSCMHGVQEQTRKAFGTQCARWDSIHVPELHISTVLTVPDNGKTKKKIIECHKAARVDMQRLQTMSIRWDICDLMI